MQSAVDPQHHPVGAHDVVMTGSDRRQLSRVAANAKRVIAILGAKPLMAIEKD